MKKIFKFFFCRKKFLLSHQDFHTCCEQILFNTDCDFLYFLLKSSNKCREWIRFSFRMVILESGSLTLTKLFRTSCPLVWSESGPVDISFGSLSKHVLVFIYYSSDIANKQPTNSSKTADK